MRGRVASLLLVLAACHPATPRPYFPPVTGAAQVEIELGVRAATDALADVLKGDSLPLTRVEPGDGYLETAWFDVHTHRPTRHRVLGPDVVQVRAWVDPSRPDHSLVTVETVYRPVADPSLSARDLDRQVPPDHPVGKRMVEVITELAKLYTTEPAPR